MSQNTKAVLTILVFNYNVLSGNWATDAQIWKLSCDFRNKGKNFISSVEFVDQNTGHKYYSCLHGLICSHNKTC